MLRSGCEKPANGRRRTQHLHADRTDSHANDAAEKAEQRGLVKNHPHDASARPADREQHANFMGALENGHEHGVHHAEHADEHGQKRSAPTHRPDHAKSLAVAQVFAHGHGADLRDVLLDLLSKFRESVARSSRASRGHRWR